jgi:hypothetical protein
MAEEEEVMQPLFEELYTTEELLEIHARLIASIGPEEMLASMRIMLPANDLDVRWTPKTAALTTDASVPIANMKTPSTSAPTNRRSSGAFCNPAWEAKDTSAA